MRRLFSNVLPTGRVGMALWAWKYRYRLLDWLGFGLRAAADVASGNGTTDAKAELRLRTAIARDPYTRNLAIEVSVDRGVATLSGRVSPETKARIQDKAVAIRSISRVNDRLVVVSPRSRRFRLRAA